jgi:DNA-binding LacI/PurR family transcriptional regulator
MAKYVNQTDYQLILETSNYGETIEREYVEITLTKPDGTIVDSNSFRVENGLIKWSPEDSLTFNIPGRYKFTISISQAGAELPADPVYIKVKQR